MNLLFLMNEATLWEAPLTYLLIGITIYTSYRYMEDRFEKGKLMFTPYAIKRNKEWYRFFSHGLVHGDWMHLLFNVYVLYMFGTQVEIAFQYLFGVGGTLAYLGLYISGLGMSSLYSYYKHQDNPQYHALGASGAVSSVVFAYILLTPTSGMGLLIISDITGIYFPSFFFGGLYLAYSAYKSKRDNDNIGHDAHYWGSVWGFVFLATIRPSLFISFLSQIRTYFGF